MKSTNEIQILRKAMLFSLTRHAWSNRCKADSGKLKTEEADELGAITIRKVTSRVNATKRLIMCDEYDAVVCHLNETYAWCLDRSMFATGISRGVYFVRRDMVNEFEAHIDKAKAALRETFVPALLQAYPLAKLNAARPVNEAEPENGGLGSLYNEADYPTAEALAASFGVEHSWFALSVPHELPEEVRLKENAKLKQTFADAQQDIIYALREGFAGLLEHAIDRLHVAPGESAKVFKADAMVGQFTEFFETFHAKNLMDDAQLAEAVNKAKEVVKQFAPNVKDLRNSNSLRNAVAAQFAGVKQTMDGLLKDKPKRKFNFD